MNRHNTFWHVLAILAVLVLVLASCMPPTDAPLQVHITNLDEPDGTRGTISRTGIIDQNGDGLVTWNSGDIATYSDAGSTSTFSVDGATGDVTIGGSVTASEWVTDSTSLALSGTLTMTGTNEASGSANPIDYTAELGIMNGSDSFVLFDVNITNADHTGDTNTVQVIDIAGITGDTHATETAISVGTGWDTGLDLNGTPITLGADGGVTLDETSDDVVALTTGAGTGTFSVLTGNFKVGDGSPTTPQNGEDAYIKGVLEVDGAANFDGAVTAGANLDLNGTNLYIGADQGIYVDETSDGVATMAMGAGTDTFSFLTGNVKVGDGSPGTPQDGEDFYVQGGFELDGTAKLDGAVNTTGLSTLTGGATVGGWVTLSAQSAISVTAGAIITPTGTYQALESAEGVTCNTTTCIADGTTDGDLLVLRNKNASGTITIDGTGANVECKTDKVLDVQDVLTLMWNGSDWVCISLADNS